MPSKTPRKSPIRGSRSSPKKGGQEAPSLFDVVGSSSEARDTVRAMLALRRTSESWRGLIATPPGSLLETVVAAFRSQTDIPLEIPFMATLHLLSAHLLAQDVVVEFAGQEVRPDLWSVVLADSGSGKTYATNQLQKVTGVESSFPEPASAAKFVEDLKSHNRSLWIRDEFAQFLKSLEQQQHLAELKDYLLRVYDGKLVERNTKKSSITVSDPALTILGMTVLESFQKHVSTEAMLDGFAARFSYVIARRDPERPGTAFPIYDMRGHQDRIKNAWEKVIKSAVHQRYHVGPDGEEAFKEAFSLLFPVNAEVPLAFFRRIMFRGVRYALLYHLLLGREGQELDAQDMGWGARVCALHVQDAAELVGNHGLPDLEKLCRRAEEIRDTIRSQEDRDITPRDLIRHLNAIRNANDARAVLSMINT